jgi:hypothetical protein
MADATTVADPKVAFPCTQGVESNSANAIDSETPFDSRETPDVVQEIKSWANPTASVTIVINGGLESVSTGLVANSAV